MLNRIAITVVCMATAVAPVSGAHLAEAHPDEGLNTSSFTLAPAAASVLLAAAEPIELDDVMSGHTHPGLPPGCQLIGTVIVNGVVKCVFRCLDGSIIIEECPI